MIMIKYCCNMQPIFLRLIFSSGKAEGFILCLFSLWVLNAEFVLFRFGLVTFGGFEIWIYNSSVILIILQNDFVFSIRKFITLLAPQMIDNAE